MLDFSTSNPKDLGYFNFNFKAVLVTAFGIVTITRQRAHNDNRKKQQTSTKKLTFDLL